MDQVDGETVKKKQVLFSISSYSEKEPRVINKIQKFDLFSSPEATVPLRKNIPTNYSILRNRPSSLNTNDTTKKYNTLPIKRPATVHWLTNGDELNKNGQNDRIDKPTCPPSLSRNDNNSCSMNISNGVIDKPVHPPKNLNRSISLEPEELRNTGKVALTIAAYEGESKTPTRLEFLPQVPKLSRSSSKSSSLSSASTPIDETFIEPISSKLQDELVATLKRSNLKKINDQDHNLDQNE